MTSVASPIEQWTIMNHSDATESQAPAPSTEPKAEPKIELTVNAKPAEKNEKDSHCTCPVHPKLDRKDTVESSLSDDEIAPARSGRPRRRAPYRRYSPSPIRIRSRSPPDTIRVSSSKTLLEKVGTFDGVADLPYPARSSIYLTTFPFTDRDVEKWTWLFGIAVEGTWMFERGGLGTDDERFGHYGAVFDGGNRRSRSPYYDPLGSDIPNVYLSRALDASIIPEEEMEKKVRYWIVVQNRARPPAYKLLVAESRQAAGIMAYYEALTGNSVVFVGAVLEQKMRLGRVKFRKVEDLNEAEKVQGEDEGVVGVVC
ncbi:hypothetical protein K469DRAFT_716036 [Zopfia rhizophila CBS 207.26]|uniref:Uncharacterized protein n=1 Tax=Zopfia rhizophila CBS 207.26 TaxID=1314779 RepID=A0A6A6DJI3_9PEZI|nr:hypothetical protein K469DRAFT_716036 [Zopfia rhizophila CBS 207.26]